MKHYSFKTNPIQIDTSVATVATEAPTYPYITYRCRSPIDLNFLLREFVEYGTQIRTIPTYASQSVASLSDPTERTSDRSQDLGMAYCLRLLGALTLGPLPPSEAEALDAKVLAYGPPTAQGPTGDPQWQSYRDGIPPNPPSVSSDDPLLATMDLGEFFQVALSAIRNKARNAATSARRGLVDRESISQSAVAQDLAKRSLASPQASDLLWPLLRSSQQGAYVATGSQTVVGTGENWIKNIASQILGTSDPDSVERYLQIRLTGCHTETAKCLRLIDGDAIVLVMQIRLSKQDGTVVPNDCPNYPGIPMTIGFRIEHRGPPAIPIGWELVGTPPPMPTGLVGQISPETFVLTASWDPLPDCVQYVVTVYDTLCMSRRTQIAMGGYADMGHVSPSANILVTVFARDLDGVSGQPVSVSLRSPSLPHVPNWSGYLAESLAGMFLAIPPVHRLFAGRYSLMVGDRTLAGVGNSFTIGRKDMFCGEPRSVEARLAAIFVIGGRDYIGPYGDPIALTPQRTPHIPTHCDLPVRWRSDAGTCDLVVTSDCDVSLTVGGFVREIQAGGFTIFHDLREGEHLLSICDVRSGGTGTKRCVIMRHVSTSG